MLKQAGKPQKGANEQGSVLLAVVCMGMVTVTLASVALWLINYNIKATARNVERSQAKITAEAALNEFVSSYNGNYDSLKTFSAGRTSASTPIGVTFLNDAGDDNTAKFGTTNINVYEQGSGFKVTSTCDYMGQVQTASLIFAASQDTPYVPTNTLEASDGSNYGGAAWPMDGDMYLERGTDSNKTMTFHDGNGGFHSHVYTEYSIKFDTGTEFHDVTNKSGSKNFEPNKSASSTDSGEYFEQAMTIRTTGYMKWDNPTKYGTSVGKTDENGRNGDDSGYQPGKLSNKDGWIYAENKILLCGNQQTTFGVGSDTLYDGSSPAMGKNPIDMYCHGMYVGTVPDNIGGSANPETSTIDGIYGGHSWDSSSDYSVNGNVYCYKGSGSATGCDNGDLVISFSNPKTLNIYGDLVVQGTIYMSANTTIDLHGGTLYANDIKFLDGNTIGNASAMTSNSHFTNCTIKGFAELDPSNTSSRDDIPTLGYSPSTGTPDSVRKGLKATYQDASTNKIFKESLSPANTYYSASKDIANKYAQALSRTLDTKTVSGSDLSQKFTDGTYTVTQINDSLRLRPQDLAGSADSDVKSKIYNIKLTDHDIVIAMPINGMKNNPNTLMRIDSTDRTTDCFVYYMYYDENDCDFTSDPTTYNVKCMYLDNADKSFTVSRDKNSGGTENVTINFIHTDYAARNSKEISYSNNGFGGSPGLMIGDPTIWKDYGDADHIDFNEFIARTMNPGTRPSTNVLRTYNQQSQENLSMFLVPDNVKFTINERATLQGIVYGPDADVTFGGSSSSYSYVFGQVKCRKFSGPGNFDEPMIFNIPPARNSIMDYVGAVNATTSSIDIAYYQY